MCNRGVEATVATYGTLICIAAAAGLTGRVRQAWGWLRASGLEVHVTCANAYLQALVKEVREGRTAQSERACVSVREGGIRRHL
jgi:hypothetical protein